MAYHKHSMETYKNFLKGKFSSNFGVTEEKAISWFMSQQGSADIRRRYGITSENLKSTYIPNLKKRMGGYVFFLMYAVTEGGGTFGTNWINHYVNGSPQSRRGLNQGLEAMNIDIDYLLKIAKQNHPVAMSAPEVSGRAIEDNPGTAQKWYNEMDSTSIGKVFMPSTMAGNAWVFARKWCNANRGPSAPSVYFGNPYDHMIDAIKSMGGDLSKGAISSGVGGGGDASGNLQETDSPSTSGGNQIDFQALINELKEKIKDMFNPILPLVSNHHNSNNILTVSDFYKNAVKVSLNSSVLDSIFDIDLSKFTLNQEPKEEKKDPIPSGGGGSGSATFSENQKASEKIEKSISKYSALIGQKVSNGECYGFAGVYANEIDGQGGLIWALAPAPKRQAIGETLNAHNIGYAWKWDSNYWTHITSNFSLKRGDLVMIKANSGAPNYTLQYGHVAVVERVEGNTVHILEQNQFSNPYRMARGQYNLQGYIGNIRSILRPK